MTWLRQFGLWIVGLLLLALALARGAASADSPDQLARGAEVFTIRCQPCHGDVGQGLALWRLTWAPEDQNCASRKCHGLGHPPDGFYMPNDAPAIIGKGALTHFATARELYGYISRRMPFDKPGELSASDYWAVAAYLLRENGKLPAGIQLDDSTAGAVAIGAPAAAPEALPAGASVALLILAGFVGSVCAWAAVLKWRKWRKH